MPPLGRRLRVTCPARVEAISPDGAPVPIVWIPPEIRGGRAPYLIQYSRPSGSLFALGETRVDVTVTSADNRMGTCFFPVVVVLDPLPGPANLAATFVAGTQIDLIWLDVAVTETGYEVQRKTGAGAFTTLTTLPPNSASYTDNSGTAGTTYTYRVRAFRGPEFSQFSNEDDATIPSSEAYDYFVATTGSDLNPGTQAQPFATINHAKSVVVAGDSVAIRAGVYAEELFWSGGAQGDAWATPILFKAYDGVGTVTVRPPAGAAFCVAMRGAGPGSANVPRYVEFDGIVFDGINIALDGVKITAWDATINPADAPAHHIRFRNCRITNVPAGQGIMVTWGSDDCELIDVEIDHIDGPYTDPPFFNTQGVYGAAHGLLLQRVHVHDCWGYGISNISSQPGQDINDNTIDDCDVHDCGQGGTGLGGVNLGEGTGHKVRNTRIWNNAGPGLILDFGPGSTGTELDFTTVVGNSGVGIRISAQEVTATVRNCVSHSNAGGNYSNSSASTQTVTNHMSGVDPLFVNQAIGDFHLQNGSPLINAGTTIAGITTDADGVTRGTPPEIGAYEKV